MDGMLAQMPVSLLRRWRMYFILKDSDADPGLTKWDTEETAQRKMADKAARDAEAALHRGR